MPTIWKKKRKNRKLSGKSSCPLHSQLVLLPDQSEQVLQQWKVLEKKMSKLNYDYKMSTDPIELKALKIVNYLYLEEVERIGRTYDQIELQTKEISGCLNSLQFAEESGSENFFLDEYYKFINVQLRIVQTRRVQVEMELRRLVMYTDSGFNGGNSIREAITKYENKPPVVHRTRSKNKGSSTHYSMDISLSNSSPTIKQQGRVTPLLSHDLSK